MKKILLTLVVALTSLCASAITMDDLCGVYTRHMENVSTGGMGATIIADVTLQVTKKDDNTLVFSKLFIEDGYPVEGVVDLAANTITFAPGQTVGVMYEFPQILANSWGGTKDDEPIVGTIAEDGTITLGSEEEAYAGFCVTLPTGMTIFQAQGIITLTKDPTTRWFTTATYKMGDGEEISGTGTLVCCNPELTGYDYRMELKTYWGAYTLYIKAEMFYEDISCDVYIYHPATEESEAVCDCDEYLWWMNFYEYEHWSEYLHLNSASLVGGGPMPYVAGDAQNGTIQLWGEYVVYTAESEEALEDENLQPVVHKMDWFKIVWGDGGPVPDFRASITSASASKTPGAIYNMAGQRVEKPTRGLFIRDGKKYLVK